MKLEKNTYSVPQSLILKAAKKEVMTGLAFVIAGIAASIYIQLHDTPLVGDLAIYGVTAVGIGILIYGYIYAYLERPVKYNLNGIAFVFTDRERFVPPDVMERFLTKEVYRPFETEVKNPKKRLEGVTVVLEGHDMKLGKVDVYGLTYPRRRYSRVESDRVLDPGVMGWELKLQMMQTIKPNQSEEKDIEWMRERNIV